YIYDKDESFISQTILDGNEAGTVVNFRNGESREAKLIGFTIQNGRVDLNSYEISAGVDIHNSNPTVSDLIIKNNRSRNGGGLYVYYAEPTISNITFESNIASDNGDDLYIQSVYANTKIDHLYFSGNKYSQSKVYIQQNHEVNIDFNNWTFENIDSGALYCNGSWNTSTKIELNNFRLKNTKSGFNLNQGHFVFNNFFAEGVESDVLTLGNSAYVALINSTLVRNNLAVRMTWGDSKLFILNSILRNNLDEEIVYDTNESNGKSIEIAYSNIKGGELAVQGNKSNLFHYNYADNNIDKREFFKDAENTDFHLLDYSPSIAAGVAEYSIFDHTYKVLDTDFDGNRRSIPTNSNVDLGAFENSSITKKVVKPISCNGENDGIVTVEYLGESATYLWDNGATTNKITNVEADKYYYLTVTDEKGTTHRDSVILVSPDELVAFVSDSTNISRVGLADGDAKIEVSGGTPPYAYLWEETNNTTNYANNLEANKFYHVTVIDQNGCQAHITVILKVLPIVENDLCGFAREQGEVQLNSTNINAIETDFEGVIWFATESELTSYNGKDWDVINANYSYKTIHKDKKGNIWLGAAWEDKGLNMYNGESWFAYKQTDGLAGNSVYDITEDSYGNLWIATNNGVSRYNGVEFANFSQTDGLIDNYITSIFADKDGYIWVGTNSGISRYKTLSEDQGEEWENFNYENSISLQGAKHITQDLNGNIYMCTSSYDSESSLIKYDGSNWTAVQTGLDIPLNDITDIYCDLEGGVWVGTPNGLAHFDGNAWHAYKNDVELPSNNIAAVGEDAFGAIWVGYSYNDNGISKYFNGQWKTLNKADGNSNNMVQALALDAENNLWVGTSDWNNSLKRFDGNSWKIFNQEDGFWGSVYDLDTDSELKVWVATDQGLLKYNGTTFDRYDASSGLPQNHIPALTIDANDNVWMWYGNENGITKFAGNQIDNYVTEDGLLENYVKNIESDSKGNIWISYSNEHQSELSMYNGEAFTTHDFTISNYENFPINKLFVDSKDRVWIGSNNKLKVLDNEVWIDYDLNQYFDQESQFNSIGEDADGNIWIGLTDMYNAEMQSLGVLKFDGTNWTKFTQEDGLSKHNITQIQDDNKGHIWFGTQSGLVRYTKCLVEEVNITVSNGTCTGEGNRELTITPTGDNAPYQYSIDGGISSHTENVFKDLSAGNYHIIVLNKDNDLIADREIVITEPVPLRANIEGKNTTCNGREDGSAICVPSGGTMPYTYSWNNNESTTSATVGGLAEDVEYEVIVTDANGCTDMASVKVGHDPQLKFTDWSNISCYGLKDGMAVITPIGGKAPFAFAWDDELKTTDSINNSLSGGKYYHITVTDANNCVAVDSIKLEEPGEFKVEPSFYNSCDGENTGGIDLVITGGTIPYTYLWDDENASTEDHLYGIGAGVYNTVVTDSKECTATTTATIVEHDDSQSVEIVGSKEDYFCPGATELVATDGFESYIWSTGETEKTIVPELPGKHFVRVFTENGCSATDTIEIRSLRTYQEQQLCLVTVNQDNKNEIVWERRNGFGIVSYNIYKESNAASSFELVKNIPIDEKSALVDEDSDPSSRSHTYAISIVDVCGVESSKSDIHHTMLLQANQGINGVVNLDWNKYEGFEFETYNIYRGTSVDDMTLLTSISNTESKFIDNKPLEVEQYYYVLEVQNDYTCDPSQLKSSFTNYSVSRSNYLTAKSVSTGIEDPESDVKSLIIYPNPMKEKSMIEFDNPNFYSYNVSVYDANGRLLIRKKNINSNRFELMRGDLSSGQYIIEIRGEYLYRGRLIVE
ncbi:MAG: T9SS type A sorting domain-containing protein, partial [Bacteroidales bacterium]|nr:T9SS type A sorting domain-containing protein [Bacteroidales bacterium]